MQNWRKALDEQILQSLFTGSLMSPSQDIKHNRFNC